MSKTKTRAVLHAVQDIRDAYAGLNIDTTFNSKTGRLVIYTRKVKVLYAILDMGTWYVTDM